MRIPGVKLSKVQSWLVLIFWAAASFALVMALLPKPPHLPGSPSDKVQHILAFSVLAALGASAYPLVQLLKIGVALSIFGALIEVLQAIPQLHRDASALDWLADTAAVAVVLALICFIRMSPRRVA